MKENALAEKPQTSSTVRPRVLSVAPMITWTNRHCRRFHRELTAYSWLYTEMVTTGALINGDRRRYLQYSHEEHPVAFQIGGSDLAELAQCARWVEQARFDQLDLNCGCPSERVQKGSFGACLMAEPQWVAQCVKAMRDACSLEVTVKHRIGLDYDTSEQQVFDFIGTVADAGCNTFVVHARNAVLKGLSPKQNREIPPLRYDVVQRLKKHFPDLQIVLNGGIKTVADIEQHLMWADGCMIGREAYTNPWLLTQFDEIIEKKLGGALEQIPGVQSEQAVNKHSKTRQEVIANLQHYVIEQINAGEELRPIIQSWLGLFHGQPKSRLFRQVLSDTRLLKTNNWAVVEKALAQLN